MMARYIFGMMLAVLAWSSANAYSVQPGSELCTGNSKGPSIFEEINDGSAGCGTLAFDVYGTGPNKNLKYKSDVGGGEEGPAASYYSWTRNSDDSGGTLSNGGGMYIDCPVCYLLVKDGNGPPVWYFFELVGWNGEEDLILSNFWPGEGAISNIQLWGGTLEVPTPAPLALMGFGLLVLGWVRRRRIV
jgi:hypothetical protein